MLGTDGIQPWCPLEKACGVTVYIVVFVVIVLLSSVPPMNDPDTGPFFPCGCLCTSLCRPLLPVVTELALLETSLQTIKMVIIHVTCDCTLLL